MHLYRSSLHAAIAVGLWAMVALASPCLLAAPLKPMDFASLGALNLAGGAYTIDTDALTIVADAAPGTPLFTGVVDDQGGMAQFEVVPEIAVFTFDSIDLQPSATVTITGTRALALLSRGDARIATPLSVDGQDGQGASVAPGGRGGPGGFDGGASVAIPTPEDFSARGLPGRGPGAGQPADGFTFVDQRRASGHAGFGGAGTSDVAGTVPGPAYGDLRGLLQGGSGGASHSAFEGIPAFAAAGGGGGGALELAASGVLSIEAGVSARGGNGGANNNGLGPSHGGSGSGGGIRLSGAAVRLEATVSVRGGTPVSDADSFGAGGGRVLIEEAPGSFALGLDLGALQYLSRIDVNGHFDDASAWAFQFAPPVTTANLGVITLTPALTVVTAAQTLTLGEMFDLSTASVRVEVFTRDIRIGDEGTALVTAAGYDSVHRIELASETAVIDGTGVLTNASGLRGSGRIQVPVVNTPGGTIDAVNDTLTLTGTVTNQAGAQINAINSTLEFNAGVDSSGAINLINTTVHGDLINNGTVTLGGTNTFTGNVTGTGTFSGTGTAVFEGNLAPGGSAGD